jgi:hypothetical protein
VGGAVVAAGAVDLEDHFVGHSDLILRDRCWRLLEVAGLGGGGVGEMVKCLPYAASRDLD